MSKLRTSQIAQARDSAGNQPCKIAFAYNEDGRDLNYAPGGAIPSYSNVSFESGAAVFNGDGEVNLGKIDHGTNNITMVTRFIIDAFYSSLHGISGYAKAGNGNRFALYVSLTGELHIIAQFLGGGNTDRIIYKCTTGVEYIVATVMNRDTDTVLVYLNGQLITSFSFIFPDGVAFVPDNDYRFGSYADAYNNPTNQLRGKIFPSFLFNTALSAEAVIALTEMLSRGSTETWQSMDFECSEGLFDFNWNGPNKIWVFPDGSVSTLDRPAITLTEAGTVKLLYLRDEDIEGNYSLNDNTCDGKFKGDLSVFSALRYSLNLASCYYISGDLSSVSGITVYLSLYGCFYVTGNLSSVSGVTGTLNLTNCSLIEGDLLSVSGINYSLSLTGCTNITGYLRPTCTAKYIYLQNCPNIDIDNTLINLAQNVVTTGVIIQADGTTPAPDRDTPDVVAAIATLEANYATVTLN